MPPSALDVFSWTNEADRPPRDLSAFKTPILKDRPSALPRKLAMHRQPERIAFVDEAARQRLGQGGVRRRVFLAKKKTTSGSPPPSDPLPPTPSTPPTPCPKTSVVQLDESLNAYDATHDIISMPLCLRTMSHPVPSSPSNYSESPVLDSLPAGDASDTEERRLEKEILDKLKGLDLPPTSPKEKSTAPTLPAITTCPAILPQITLSLPPSPTSANGDADDELTPLTPLDKKPAPIAQDRRTHMSTPSDTSIPSTISTVIGKMTMTTITLPVYLPPSPSLPLFSSSPSDAEYPALHHDLADLSVDIEHIGGDWVDPVDNRDSRAARPKWPPPGWAYTAPSSKAGRGKADPNQTKKIRRMDESELGDAATDVVARWAERERERVNAKDRKRRGKVFVR
ncbi:hypothetical protein SISNIDRAFT_469001 [Sistotremastrum niveocremeum HHB9708]|uniref:Uncharacterized protein n=1 Tax=Sistotremastrum niveocremeum HHB9708 TaxID=1314777 RepID=A0A164QK94_9AGAM|nr:hypothetical protein SISNIDRAFT_469001 [Sistotremastrum niveocremeum HHB9708]